MAEDFNPMGDEPDDSEIFGSSSGKPQPKNDVEYRLRRLESQLARLEGIIPQLRAEKTDLILTYMKELAKDIDFYQGLFDPVLSHNHDEVLRNKERYEGTEAAYRYCEKERQNAIKAINTNLVIIERIKTTMNLLNKTLKADYESETD